MEIRLIPHAEIDKIKWNSCVHYATNGNVFGYKWYLDTIAKEWDGLIEGDYESVLPLFLTERKDLLEQPSLLREAGIYSINLLSHRRVNAFLDAIPNQYENISIRLNEGIHLTESSGFSVEAKNNYQLLLLEPYTVLSAKYSPDLMRFLKSNDKKKLLPSSNVKPEKIAGLFKDNSPDTPENNYAFHAYQRIMYNALHRGWGATFGVMDQHKDLLSAAFFIYSQGRVMQLVAATTPQGEQMNAYDYLIDNFLQSHAGRPLVMDFNTAEAYPKRFGARHNEFLTLQKGTIPKPLLAPVKKKPSWKFW